MTSDPPSALGGSSADAGDAVIPRLNVPTVEGPAQLRVLPGAPGPRGERGTVLLGHGAGGQRDAADVLALTALTDDGWTVVLVDQPWRVAGRKVATRPPALDRAFEDILAVAADRSWQDAHGVDLPRPWILGGRSAGARVACRASLDPGHPERPRDGIAGVVALAFPLHPPGRPDRSRAEELAGPVGAGLPTLVVQGRADPFGSPEEIRDAIGGPALTLHAVPGNHSPSRDLDTVLGHVRDFLTSLGR